MAVTAARLTFPFTADKISRLRAGDAVALCGSIHTGRDRFHKCVAEAGASRVDLRGGALFHCGPIISAPPWRVIAAGPTTSIREEPYMPRVIAALGLRVIIGKGGMGAATAEACRKHGCVYLQAVGGAAALIAKSVRRVAAVEYLEEFGAAEAVWSFEVEDFEAVCAIDTLGANLHQTVREASAARLAELFGV